jgi:NADPH-dependent curcumin reductase CurA
LVAARPEGKVRESDFLFVDSPIPEPRQGEFLVKVMFLSVAPVLRRHLMGKSENLPPLNTGEVMRGRGVGRVIVSHHPEFAQGDIVQGKFGWQEYAISAASPEDMVHKVLQRKLPFSTSLGVLGPTGFASYLALNDIGQPRPGDAIVVSRASSGVGSNVGQIARILGCSPVLGIAGSRRKCRFMVENLGYDAAINYRQEDLGRRLDELCPDGVDIYFDNVGGQTLDTVLARIKPRGRIILCERMSDRDREDPRGIRNYGVIGNRQARMEGFNIYQHESDFHRAEAQLTEWLSSGKMRYLEDRLEGIEMMPKALLRLFQGKNLGKQLVRVDPEAE